MPAPNLDQCLADMRDVALNGRWTLEAQENAYDLLDLLAGYQALPSAVRSGVTWEPAFVPETVISFCEEYDILASSLEAAYDESALRALLEENLKALREAVAQAEKKAETLADLHECAKETFAIWQNGGVFVRHKALRILRKKAGFRLERKRIGNYVAKTFDLMNDARTAYARAQQLLFAADMSYKIRPGIYAEIRAKLNSLLSENHPLAKGEVDQPAQA